MAEKTTLNCCPGVGCHAGCIHRTHIEEGKIVRVEPLTYPDGEKGLMCAKGEAGARLPYHPGRLKHPLKRAGKRGEGKWERISWEKALDEIADKIKRIRQKFGPESVLMVPAGNSVPYAATQIMLGFRLKNLLGATGLNYGVPIDCHPQFSGFFTYGSSQAHFMDPRTLIEGETRYMIVWGCNPADMSNRYWKQILRARKKGAKLVDIGLLADSTARASDWFIQVKAGSDGALALAMIDVIIREGLYDRDYVTKYTNGPFLVRTDNGKILREGDVSPNGTSENYMVWDEEDGRPKGVKPHADIPGEVRAALSGRYEVGGLACRPAFQMLSDVAGNCRPSEVEEITGVPTGTIEKLAREYATAKPAAILLTFGLRYKNSGNAIRAMDILGAITGNIGVMGGGTILGALTTGQNNAPLLKLNDLPIMAPAATTSKMIPSAQVLQCLITGRPFPIKAMISYAFNTLNTFPHPGRWIDEIFPNLDLIVVNDIFLTATAEYADYVLPDCTLFERDDMDIGYNGHVLWLDKAIEPMHDARPPIYFWSELARRLGFGEYFDKTIEEWTALRLDSEDPSVAGIDPPLTFERLKKEKIVRANVPDGVSHPWLEKRFLTPSGKLEFYHEVLLPAGDALPVFREQMESPRSKLADQYPLVFNSANTKYFLHSLFPNDPEILKKYMNEPHVEINPLDAVKRNISQDDVVIIYNDRGKCKVKALVSENVPPGVIHLPYGWWPNQFLEGHPQNLITSLASSETRHLPMEIHWDTAMKRSAPTLPMDIMMSYSPDTLFDCLCEVKKTDLQK